jgi:AAA15 family ATPase/GTPase
MKMRSKVIKRGTGSGLRYRELELCGVELENFRAFSSAQHFSIAPVTLLFGANSTGKSTVLHALGLLRQSIVSGVNPGRLLVRGQDVDFGIASEVPNRANPQDEIAIRLFFNRQEDQESKTLQEGGVLKFFTPFEEYAFEKSEKKVGLGIKAIAQTSSEGISELLLS